VTVIVQEPETSSPTTPRTSTPTTSAPVAGTVASGQITEIADPAGGKPTASLAISDAALTAALQNAVNSIVTLNISDVDFSKYGQVNVVLTAAQADKLKSSTSALSLTGKGFALLIPAGTLPDFITASGLTVSLSLNTEADTAPLSGSTKSIDIGSSSLTIKNGWTTNKPVLVQLRLVSIRRLRTAHGATCSLERFLQKAYCCSALPVTALMLLPSVIQPSPISAHTGPRMLSKSLPLTVS
jgi:minor extracellular serine protease Vpr